MKKILLILGVLIASISQVNAQRYLPGQKGIQFTTGGVNGFNFANEDGQAFFASIAMSRYNKAGDHWVFGAEYLQKKYAYSNMLIPVSQITGEGGYYYNFLSDPSKTLFFSIGGSALAGYETINWGKEVLSDGATIKSKDSFLYGGAISLEMETYLSDRIIMLITARERILFGSSISKFHTQLGVGIRVIIN